MTNKSLAAIVMFLSVSTAIADQSLWDKTKSATKSAGEAIGDVADSTVDSVKKMDQSPDDARAEIDAMEKATMNKLFNKSSGAKKQFDNSFGYAVFDSRRMSFMLTTEFGAGVAIDRKSGKRTYMKMASGGVNVGYGAQLLQLIFLFPDSKTYSDFVENGWDAGADAGGVLGKDNQGMGLELKNGVIVRELNETGLALSATLTGTKYWKDDKLN